jgi:hypothetical protein
MVAACGDGARDSVAGVAATGGRNEMVATCGDSARDSVAGVAATGFSVSFLPAALEAPSGTKHCH